MSQQGQFVFCSEDSCITQQLAACLDNFGVLQYELPAVDALTKRLQEQWPNIVFLDFVPSPDHPTKLSTSAELARLLARLTPTLPRVAVGDLSSPEGAVAALRAGVSDFVDINDKDDLRAIVQKLMREKNERQTVQRYRTVLLLGARAGLGTTTLAVHLASLLQQQITSGKERTAVTPGQALTTYRKKEREKHADAPLHERIGLLDFGMPIADCLLYLNLRSEFDFAEAAANLPRLDHTLLMSAIVRNETGLSVLSLPRKIEQLRNVSHSDSMLLLERLREHFGGLVIDAGGLANTELTTELVRAADETWIVADQHVGALVSLSDLVSTLGDQGIDPGELHLVVNRYNERHGMEAGQIAAQFRLHLKGTLPDRTAQLRTSSGQAQLLHQMYGRDPYIKAVRSMAGTLAVDKHTPISHALNPQHWLAHWRRRAAS